MDRKKLAALAFCLPMAVQALAQIPRDPFPGSAAPLAPAADAPRELPKPFVTKQSDVEIPFSVRAGTSPETEPTAVRVFVSWDQGKSWHFYDERRPEEGRFRFRARQDGEFWFATQTIDRSGRTDTPQPKAPQLRLVIDTQRPQLLVQAQVDSSGNVNLALSAADTALSATTLKVEYQDAAGTGGAWQLVEVRPAGAGPAKLTGQTTFRPSVTSPSINVRAEIADAAGNVAYHSQRLSLNPPKPKNPAGLGNVPVPDPSATQWPTAVAPAESGSEQVRIPALVANPFLGPGRLASGPTSPASGQPPAPTSESLPPPTAPAEALLPPPAPPPTLNSPQSIGEGLPAPAADSIPLPPAVTNSPESGPAFGAAPVNAPPAVAETMPAPTPSEPVDTPTAQRPRLTNSRRFSLEYDVETVGPEGLQAVELWGTTDGGRTWVKWGADPDKQSPFEVEVNNEAIYGFRIVIVGRNGLATSSPRPGEAADIWVGVDLTRPAARLTSAAYGQGDASGKLDIRWEASDANLGSRAISLSIGERPSGPFSPLAAGLPNNGQYLWEFDPRSPRQIFLRLEVRDEAGNIAVDQLTDPIKVEGLEPKGRIREFNAGPEPIQGAFRPPLFR
jgi:hypothetical protein